MGMSGQCRNLSLEDWRKIMAVNLDGAFMGIRGAINTMVENNCSGSIINISSASGLVGGGLVPYSTAKGGMTMLTKSVANECGRLGYNIRVNTVYPGVMKTSMWTTPRDAEEAKAIPSEEEKNMLRDNTFQHIPLGRAAEPIEVAKGILFLASDDSSYMTGSSLVIDGGYTSVGGQTLPKNLLE
jgi:NAD(P)-dependent dehydrogenase (short-subunit alcohol dehydrogenase family)